MKSLYMLLAIALMPIASLPARAGGGGGFAGATEVTQIANNVELALQSAEDMAQTYEIVEQTYLARMQQMASSIGAYTVPYQKVLDAHSKVQNAQRAVHVLQGGLGGLKTMLTGRFRALAASGLTWDQYLAREQSLIQSANVRARAELESNLAVMESTQAAIDTYQAAARALEVSTGTHQATRLLGAQLAQLGGDVNKLISLTAQANASKAEEQFEKAAEREAAAAAAEKMRQQQSEATRESRLMIERMRGTR